MEGTLLLKDDKRWQLHGRMKEVLKGDAINLPLTFFSRFQESAKKLQQESVRM